MEAELLENFRAYLVSHHPDLVLNSNPDYPLSRFIRERMEGVMPTLKFLQDQGKPAHEILAICMKELTNGLRPSRADYIREVIATEYPREHHLMINSGTLTARVAKLVAICADVFEAFGFSKANHDCTRLRHAMIAKISEDLN